MSTNRFQYQLSRDNQIQQLRRRNHDLYQQNITLKKSLQELIRVNTQLTQSIQEFNTVNNSPNVHYDSGNNYSQSQRGHHDNVEDMQNKIDMLTMEVEMLRKDIGKGGSSGAYGHQNDENVMNMVEQLLQSFRIMQSKYQTQINDLYQQIKNYKMQWQTMLTGIQNKSKQKFENFDHLITQLKKKDQIVQQIQKKVKSIEDIHDVSPVQTQKNGILTQQLKIKYQNQILQKNKIIKNYADIISKLRKKLTDKN